MAQWLRYLSTVLVLLPLVAFADDLQPVYAEFTEIDTDRYRVRVKVPPQMARGNRPQVDWPLPCEASTTAAAMRPATQDSYQCSADIAGLAVSLVYPLGVPPTSGVVRVRYLSGEEHTVLLASGESTWPMPNRESASQVALDYTRLGVYHIWTGFDHLLFLVCLLWISGDLRRILITVTGFTLAHSVTLALSALRLVTLPVPAVEAVIALSVLFLATEVVKGRRENLTWRHPVAVSSTFGLLHGLGFAAVLKEIGLPQTELITGLVFFNVGVEIGQVVFAGGVVGLLAVSRGAMEESPSKLTWAVQRVMGYGVGCTAALWLVERTGRLFL